MSDYWRKCPPVHESVALYLGTRRTGSTVPDSEAMPAEDALISLFRDVLDSGGAVPSDAVEMALPAVGAS